MRSAPAAALVAACALALASCASSETLFIKNPPPFHGTQADPETRVWFDPQTDFCEYDRLLIDPTEVVLVSGTDARLLDPAVVRSLAVEFHDTLVRVVDPYYSVLD